MLSTCLYVKNNQLQTFCVVGCPRQTHISTPPPKARLGQLKSVPIKITCKMLSAYLYVKNYQ